MFVTHLAAQLPAGILSDRVGPHRVALAACGAGALGNALLLVSPSIGLGIVGRLVVGIGSGAAFVAGLDLVRAGRGGPVAQGFYGGATMAGGGLALVVLPPLTDATSWRAPYATGLLLALAGAASALAVGRLDSVGRAARGVLRDRDLLPLGVIQAATFGLVVIAGNWIVPLLERNGVGSAVAGSVGGLVLLAGILTRPLGGEVARRWPSKRRSLVAISLVAVASGAFVLAFAPPLWAAALAALAMGLAAGLPFAIVFEAAQRLRPDAPGAAIALINGCGVVAIVVGTPVAGLTFDHQGGGEAAFVAIGLLAAAAVAFVRRIP
jgi:MFS family permease